MNKIYEISEYDEEYPKRLLEVNKHPKKIYVMGNKKILNNRCVVMVGSRDNTIYGEYYASNYAKELSKAGITVVSGLAMGIDGICHKNSMEEKGKTIAVIGSGFYNMFPSENIELSKQIIKNGGAIISEYPPEKEVDFKNFPKRNKIIAALGECTIVVEAKARSGSSITATQTFLQGKPVFCIPGRIEDKTSKGTNNLIKKGANILTDISQILNIFGKNCKEIKIRNKENNTIKKEYQDIYKIIAKNEMNINELAKNLKYTISELNIKLTMMELEGVIEMLPGNIIKVKEK